MKKDEQNRLYSFFAAESGRLMRYVHARARRISDMDAEDIVREVMLGLLRRDDRSGPVENLAAYTYQSVRNKLADYHAEQAQTVSLDACCDEDAAFSLREMLPDETQDVIAKTEQKELLRTLSACMDNLEEKQRAVLIATEFHGRSFRELSEAWHEPMGTLLSRKCRAVKALRDMMTEQLKGE
ncbi:MAG TPA: sigma-70 family RNA polymerase sigma factor [Candidatus Limiplasma sp.]|nr:sigma-70 family RNA polymerase sigma factor [Candidatus Limiplasma sp.]